MGKWLPTDSGAGSHNSRADGIKSTQSTKMQNPIEDAVKKKLGQAQWENQLRTFQ